MTLICVPKLAIFIILISFALLFHTTSAQETTEELLIQPMEDSNVDDTSLFRGVENAIDEDVEGDDAYRIFKSLQDVTEDDFSEEDEEDGLIDHSSSKEIKERIQPEEEDQEEDEEEPEEIDDNEEEEEDEDEDEEGEEDDEEEDFSADSFPDFKNEATTEFFEHLPQQINNPEQEKEIIEDEDEIVDNSSNEEEYDDLVDNSSNNNSNNNNNNIPLPVIENNEIPWHKPDDNVQVENTFYQEYNNHSDKQKTTSSFKHWFGLFTFVILVILYKSLSSKNNAHHILDSNNSSSPWNENEYLPLHNSKGNNRHYKWEIKSS